MVGRSVMWLAALALSAATGCSSVGGSAVRTGALRLPPRVGAIGVYASSAPASGTELGVVEVHAAETEATVETLLPVFVRKVAALGGNAAVLDDVRARFEVVSRPYAESYSYTCGWRSVCNGTRTRWAAVEVLLLSMRGRAFLVGAP